MIATNPLETTRRTTFGDIQNVNGNLIDWKEVEGQPGNYIKVLVVDEKNHRVDFLFKQAPNCEFARHTHLCTAVAFTLEGLWGYREGNELHFPGTYSYEPPGTAHTPFSTDKGMVVYASFQGTDARMLEILDSDDNVVAVLTLDFFKQYLDA